ncbi:transcriptional regulator [Microbacterium sp. MYb64]|nr:transcriptional regulator [Microbacterium sp. MYb64]
MAAPGARPGVRALLDAMPQVPAFVLGPAMDVLAVNLLGDALIALPDGSRNMARHVFLDPTSPAYYPEWDKVARETAAHLRRMAALLPDAPEIASLIGELTIGSDEFVRAWARQEVVVKTHGHKLVHHPEIGRLSLDYETLALPDEPALMLVTYTAADEKTADALRTLGSWAASGAAAGAVERSSRIRDPDRAPAAER